MRCRGPLLAAMLLCALAASAAAQGVVEPLQVVQRTYMLPTGGPQGTRMALLDAASVQWSGVGSGAQAQAAQASSFEPLSIDPATAQQLADLPSTLSQPDQGTPLFCAWRAFCVVRVLEEGWWPRPTRLTRRLGS